VKSSIQPGAAMELPCAEAAADRVVVLVGMLLPEPLPREDRELLGIRLLDTAHEPEA
jgi:hypothetical protein